MTIYGNKKSMGCKLRTFFLGMMLFAALNGASMMTPRPAEAQICCMVTTCACMVAAAAVIDAYTAEQFRTHERWLVDFFFSGRILPAMMRMATELEATGMLQMHTVGAFLDAKHLMETQRLYQQLAAQAHKDYYPSEGLCVVGTSVRSLAASDRNAEVAAGVMSQRSIDRQLLNVNSSAAGGPLTDRDARLRQFKATYCDANDNNRGLGSICATTVSPARVNKDIDYTRTLGAPLTLNANFTDGATTTSPDEEDILALASNLYAHDVFTKIPKALLRNNEQNQQTYMDLRSIVAKRSVAENSFQTIAAMKSAGATNTAQTAQYLSAVLRELGLTQTDAEAIVGTNPSYYAQMEILTKKIFQSPDFILDLYDKPANVARKGVAIQAIGLMQDRDTFKSNLRTEAMLSILLELKVMKAQEAVQNEINRTSRR